MLSVVIPTKDTRELTTACLLSLGCGAAPDFECLVVDDGSLDGTADELRRRFPAVRILRNELAQGFTAAANRGLRAARGDLILLLNSDTELDAGALTRLRRAFVEDPNLGIAGATLRYPDGRPQWSAGREPGLLWFFAKSSGIARRLSAIPGYHSWRRRRHGEADVHWVSGAAMALRREVIEAVGPFDPRYRLYAQDLDLCLAARDAGWRVKVLPEFGVVHHQGATVARGTAGGTAERQDVANTWSDLLTWAEKRRGAAWARRAASVAAIGLSLRLAARRLASPLASRSRRSRWHREAAVFRLALNDLWRARRRPPTAG